MSTHCTYLATASLEVALPWWLYYFYETRLESQAGARPSGMGTPLGGVAMEAGRRERNRLGKAKLPRPARLFHVRTCRRRGSGCGYIRARGREYPALAAPGPGGYVIAFLLAKPGASFRWGGRVLSRLAVADLECRAGVGVGFPWDVLDRGNNRLPSYTTRETWCLRRVIVRRIPSDLAYEP